MTSLIHTTLSAALTTLKARWIQGCFAAFSLALSLGFFLATLPGSIQAITPSFPLTDSEQLWQLKISSTGSSSADLLNLSFDEQHDVDGAFIHRLFQEQSLENNFLFIPDISRVELANNTTIETPSLFLSDNYRALYQNLAAIEGRLARADQNELMVSQSFWQQHFAAYQPGAAYLAIDEQVFTITGILADDVFIPVAAATLKLLGKPALFIPFSAATPLAEQVNSSSLSTWLVRTDRAIDTLEQQYNQQANALGLAMQPVFTEWQPFSNYYQGHYKYLALLLGASALILLTLVLFGFFVALFTRMQKSWTEIALKYAIGGTSLTAVLQEIFEFAVIFLCGLILAIPLFFLFSHWLEVYGLAAFTLSYSEWLLTAIIALFLAVFFGFLIGLPASQLRRLSIMPALQSSGKGSQSARVHWSTKIILVVQLVVATLIFLVGIVGLTDLAKQISASKQQNYQHLYSVEVSFEPHMDAGSRSALVQELSESVRNELPGPLGYLTASPLNYYGSITGYQGGGWSADTKIIEHRDDGTTIMSGREAGNYSYMVSVVHMDTSAFELLGFRLLEGRRFTADDRAVAIVTSDAASRIFNQQQELLGRFIPHLLSLRGVEVIGVVPSSRISDSGNRLSFMLNSFPVVLLPFDEGTTYQQVAKVHLLLHNRRPEAEVMASLRRATASFRDQVEDLKPVSLETERNKLLMQHTIKAYAAVCILLLAALLASFGTYGLINYQMQLARPELSIKLMLGASPQRLLKELLSDYGGVCLLVICCVLVFVFLVSEIVSAAVLPLQLLTYQQVLFALIGLVALVTAAVLIPLSKIFRIAPMEALRSE